MLKILIFGHLKVTGCVHLVKTWEGFHLFINEQEGFCLGAGWVFSYTLKLVCVPKEDSYQPDQSLMGTLWVAKGLTFPQAECD